MERSGVPLPTPFGIYGDDKSNLCPHQVKCYICKKPQTNPVATLCGFFFCWSCIYKWLQNEPKACSICRITLTREMNIIALYELGTSAKPTNNTINANEATTSTNVILPHPPNPTSFICSNLHQVTSKTTIEGSSQEEQESALQHLEEINQMAQDIVKLQLELAQAYDLLAQANVLLPFGWSDRL